MKSIKLISALYLLAINLVYASAPCDGFNITLENQLGDDLLVTRFNLDGAQLLPSNLQKLKRKSTQSFRVTHSDKGVPIFGEILFHTQSVPNKLIAIQFDLRNSRLICEHNDLSQVSSFSLKKARSPERIEYVISEK
ncbi:MAG TPA: hypothetical protein PK657_03725 [Legionella sp.]|nr:hypothetical protein [Legionella sp.]